MHDLVFTASQTFQVVALVPCLFVVLYLTVIARQPKLIALPVLYFLAMGCGFILPLLDLSATLRALPKLHGALLLGESFGPALSFLLILQFLFGTPPAPLYWTILALPALGGSSFIYMETLHESACIGDTCVPAHALNALYHIFAALLIFLLLIILYIRLAPTISDTASLRRSKYLLVMALVSLNLAVLGIDLWQIAGGIAPDRAMFVATVIRAGFIYLVLSSIFRVFTAAFHIAAPFEYLPTDEDRALAKKITALMEAEHIYRDAKLSRATLAKRLGINESRLSRIVNHILGKSVSALVSHYRIAEAKARLKSESVAITVIAFEAGFSSVAAFNRVFREQVRMTPTEFREKSV